MANLPKFSKLTLKNEQLSKELYPLLNIIDPNISNVFYIPGALTTSKIDMNFIGVRKGNQNIYIDVSQLNPFQFASKVLSALDNENIQVQPAILNTDIKNELDTIMSDLCTSETSLVEQKISKGTKDMNTKLDTVLNTIALPNRSNKNGFYEKARLDAIENVLKDSPYKKIAATNHMVLYGRAPITMEQYSNVDLQEAPILISSHSDIVPAITKVSSKLENHVYHGTYDNLGTNAAAVMLMLEESLPDNVYFAFTDEEETGQCFGARDASMYIEKASGYSPFCIALDVTDEGFDNNRLITLEGLTTSNENRKYIADCFLSTEGQYQSCDVVRAKRKDITFFPDEYMTASTTVFDESAWYANHGRDTLSFCLPSDGYMHGNSGLDVKESVFEGYILSIASFIYAYTQTHSQLIEAYKIAKDYLIAEAFRTVIPKKTYSSYNYMSEAYGDSSFNTPHYPSSDYAGYMDDLMDDEDMEVSLYELADGYTPDDRNIFIEDAMQMYPGQFNREDLAEIFDSIHFPEMDY